MRTYFGCFLGCVRVLKINAENYQLKSWTVLIRDSSSGGVDTGVRSQYLLYGKRSVLEFIKMEMLQTEAGVKLNSGWQLKQ